MARLYTVGFELQSLASEIPAPGEIIVGAISAVEVETTVKRAGGAAVKCTPTSDESAYVSIEWPSTSTVKSNPVYSRTYFNFGSLPSSGTCRFMAFDDAGLDMANLRVDSSGVVTLCDRNDVVKATLESSVTTNVWYGFELSSVPGASVTDIVARFLVDGQEPLEWGTFQISGTVRYPDRIKSGAGASVGAVVYVDDIAVNDNSGSYQNTFPGPGRILTARPSGAGDATGWYTTVGEPSANNYQVVSSSPATTASYLLKSTAPTGPDYYTLSSVTIPEGGEVALIAVTQLSAGYSTQSDAIKFNAALRTAADTVISGTEGQVTSSTVFYTGFSYIVGDPLVSYINPDTSKAWTNDDIAGLQCGINPKTLGTSTRTKVAEVWALIEYTGGDGITLEVSNSVEASWDTLETVSSSKDDTWDTLTLANSTNVNSWDTLVLVNSTSVNSWDTLSLKAPVSNDIAYLWDTLITVTSTCTETWDVEQALIEVSNSVSHLWDAVAQVTESISHTWDISEIADFTVNASWDVDSAFTGTVITLMSPVEAKIPSLYPKFRFYISTLSFSDISGQLSLSSTSNFASETIITFTPIHLNNEAMELVTSTEKLTNGNEYYWRARIGRNGNWSDWADVAKFIIDTSSGNTSEYGWRNDVAESSDTIHLWFTRPTSVTQGDTVTVYGTGFTISDTVRLGDTNVSFNSYEVISATSDAYTSDRVIDAISGKADPEHCEATFVVPDSTSGPGVEILIEGT